MWSIFFLASVFLLLLLSSQELALEGGCTVTALTSRVIVARTHGNEHGPDP